MGQEDYLGPFLVGDFVFDNFVDSFFKSLVVGFSAIDAPISAENNLSMVDWLGF